MRPLRCYGQYNKENFVCRWLCRIVVFTRCRRCKRTQAPVERGNPMVMASPVERGNPMSGIANPVSIPVTDIERGNPMQIQEREMACFGNYNPDNYACITACMVQLECMQEAGIANPQRSCLGKFDNFPADYHDEHCASCSQVRICLHQAGIQNILTGGSYIISKPAEAPDCFGYYYDHASEDSREPSCEDMCRFFTDCIRATHSSLNFEQETRLPVEDIQERGEQMQSKDLESRREKALSLEVIPAGDTFLVKSSTRKGGYMVTPEDDGTYHCACMDYATHRGDSEWRCKHILAVEMFLEERGPMSADSRFDVIDIK